MYIFVKSGHVFVVEGSGLDLDFVLLPDLKYLEVRPLTDSVGLGMPVQAADLQSLTHGWSIVAEARDLTPDDKDVIVKEFHLNVNARGYKILVSWTAGPMQDTQVWVPELDRTFTVPEWSRMDNALDELFTVDGISGRQRGAFIAYPI